MLFLLTLLVCADVAQQQSNLLTLQTDLQQQQQDRQEQEGQLVELRASHAAAVNIAEQRLAARSAELDQGEADLQRDQHSSAALLAQIEQGEMGTLA